MIRDRRLTEMGRVREERHEMNCFQFSDSFHDVVKV